VSQSPASDPNVALEIGRKFLARGTGAAFGTFLLVFAQRLPNDSFYRTGLIYAAPTIGAVLGSIITRLLIVIDEEAQHWVYEHRYEATLKERRKRRATASGSYRRELEQKIREMQDEHDNYENERLHEAKRRRGFFGFGS